MASSLLQLSPYLLPLAGTALSIPFFGGQKEDDFTGTFKNNTVGGINFGNQANTSSGFSLPENYFKLPSKSDFQGLLNIMSGDTKALDFLKPGNLKTNKKYEINKRINSPTDFGDAMDGGGSLPYGSGIVANTPIYGKSPDFGDAMEGGGSLPYGSGIILGPDGNPYVKGKEKGSEGSVSATGSTSSTTFDNTDISSNNNNNNNKKDDNNYNKLLLGSFLINPAFEGGKYLLNKAKDMFSKKDDEDDEDDSKSDFEDITGITYKDAMDMQRKRENELMNKRALLGGINDAGQYAYLGGQAQTEAAKNIGRNTQDMLRSMAYGQAAMSKALAGASNLKALDRKYFS